MAYYLDLFSPETYEAFRKSTRDVSGFRRRQRHAAERVRPGDILVCYMTRLSRWFGLLEVLEGPFEDESPIFYPANDPFVVRFRVKPTVVLDVERAIPMYDDSVWNSLSFTRDYDKGTSTWTGKIRSSLVQLDDNDGAFLEEQILAQSGGGRIFAVEEDQYRKHFGHSVLRADGVVTVSVPDDAEQDDVADRLVPAEARESIKIQALLADIGARMGMSIWIPRSDRTAVKTEIRSADAEVLERLPLNYDDATLRTIEQIDVIWLNRRSIVRAFEVEHTTSIYSGILRMADLLALQPNMDIRLHIVAPSTKRDRVFQEIRRPVFSLLDRAPLAEICTYLSYESVRELAEQKHLEHLSPTVLEEYAEEAE